ncbi:tripartite motif-containing 2-like isoform X1, partial [Brachionus plicatilis]
MSHYEEKNLAGLENVDPLMDPYLDTEMNSSKKSDLLEKLLLNYKKIELKIFESFDLLHRMLEDRQKNLLDSLNSAFNDKKIHIENNIETLAPDLDTELFDFVPQDSINIIEHLKLSGVNTRLINSEYSNFNRIKNINLFDVINNFGKLLIKSWENNLTSLEYSISGRGLKQCYVNEEQYFSLKFKTKDGISPCKNHLSLLDIFIVRSEVEARLISTTKRPNEIQGKVFSSKKNVTKPEKVDCECKLECLSDGVYEVKYKLNKKGNYSLNIMVNKKHVANSPYKLVCLDKNFRKPEPARSSTPIKSLSSNSIKTFQGKENKLKVKPSEPKFSSILSGKKSSSSNPLLPNNSIRKSSMFLNVPKANQSSTFSLSKKADSKSISSNDDSLMSSVPSVLSDSLSNPTSPRLSKLNLANFSELNKEEDDFLFQIGQRGRHSSEFMNPQAVCATNDSIYVTDSNNQKIDVFSHGGEFKFSMTTTGASNTKIVKRPCGIVSGPGKKILVVDYELKCVNVFEENGKFVKKICHGKLLGPKGICLNKACDNQIIVADAKANSVCVFDSSGKFLQKFGHAGSKNENFAGPQYVACMSNGDICVSDFYNHCIKIFDSSGSFKFCFGSNGSEQGQFNGPT